MRLVRLQLSTAREVDFLHSGYIRDSMHHRSTYKTLLFITPQYSPSQCPPWIPHQRSYAIFELFPWELGSFSLVSLFSFFPHHSGCFTCSLHLFLLPQLHGFAICSTKWAPELVLHTTMPMNNSTHR
jgi:hypothetical protein